MAKAKTILAAEPLQPIVPSMLIANINPEDIDVIMIDSQVLVDQAARAVSVIVSREAFARAGDLARIIKGRLKRSEELRLSWTRPINLGLDNINASFRAREAPLATALEQLMEAMKTFAKAEEERVRIANNEARRKAEDEALARAAEQEQAAKVLREAETKAAESGDATTAVVLAGQARAIEQRVEETLVSTESLPEADPALRRQRGLYGATSGVRKVWRTKVLDVGDLMPEYIAAINADPKALDRIRIAIQPLVEAAIEASGVVAARAGKMEIPGLEVVHDSDPQVR